MSGFVKPQRLAAFQNELLAIANGEVYSFASGKGGWIDKGPLSSVLPSQFALVRNTYQQKTPDAATVGGVTVYAWADSRGGVWGAAVDESTGAFLLPETQLNPNGARPRVVAIGTALVVAYIETTGGVASLKTRVFDASSGVAFGGENVIATTSHVTAADQHLDLVPSGIYGAAIYAYNGTATTVRVGYIRSDGTLGSPANGGLPNPISIGEAADKSLTVVVRAGTGAVYVLYSNGAALRLAARNEDLTALVAPENVEAIANVENVTAAWDDAGDLQAFWEVQAALPYNRKVRHAAIKPDGTVGALADLRRSVALAAKAFLAPTGIHVPVVHDPSPAAGKDGLQNTYFLLTVAGRIAAKMQPGTADKIQVGQLPSVVALDADTFFWPAPVRTKFESVDNTTYSLVGLAKEILDFDASGVGRAAQIGDALLLTGGVIGLYDGAGSVVESGFLLYPENVTVVMGGAGSGALEAGTREACVVFRWTDAKGQTHRSAPSVPVQFVAAALDKATFTIPTLRLTDKDGARTAVEVELYSTEADGDVFYKTPNGAATDPVAAPLYNDPTADTVTFVRQIADTAIISNEILYTQGGVLEAQAPPAAALIAVSKNRAFVVPAENRRRVFYTKQRELGEAAAFNDALYFDVDPSGGDITAIHLLDEKVILFKARQVEVVSGDGPDDTGANDTFSPPTLVTTDVGCINPDSVAVVPTGLVFQSDKGIYHLDRSLSVDYRGAPVEDLVKSLTITSAVLVESANEVRFTTLEDADEGGRTISWNYFFNEWATARNQSAVHACLWYGTGHFVRISPDGVVYEDTPEAFQEGAQRISMKLRTAWIKTNVQGVQRVRSATLLGRFATAHKLRIRVAYDYKDFNAETYTWDPSTALFTTTFGDPEGEVFGSPTGEPFGGDQDEVYQVKVPLGRQKCQAVRFEIEDFGSTPGEAYALSAITLEVGVKSGSFRVPMAKLAGT